MIRRWIAIVALFLCVTVHAEETKRPVVRLASLEWPPYSTNSLPEQGMTSAVIRAAFAAVGYDVQIDIYPWSRTVRLGEDGASGYAGYFPRYYNEATASKTVYSPSVGEGPLGFVENIAHPVTWNTLDDLRGLTIGIVKDYANTEEFDRRVAAGELQVAETMSDRSNVLKIGYARQDLAVVDPNVLNYLIRHDQDVDQIADEIRMNGHLLEIKQLYVAFNLDNVALAEIFRQGLARIDVRQTELEYMFRVHPELRRAGIKSINEINGIQP